MSDVIIVSMVLGILNAFGLVIKVAIDIKRNGKKSNNPINRTTLNEIITNLSERITANETEIKNILYDIREIKRKLEV